ncbi:MAG: helix-turn-helix transcriptional regulator [Lachnospiraceae bacterium]
MGEDTKQGRDVSVSQRQIYILSLLSENPKGYQVEEIRERLKNWDIEVSKRTITRDIDELSLNYGICEEERGGKTYYYADKYTLKNVDLTIEDLASLAFAKEMLGEYAHLDMGNHAIAFIDKIVEGSASLNKLQFEKLCGYFKQGNKKSGNVDVVDARTEKMIQNAIDNRNKIEMEYYSFTSDASTKRIIHPYRMLLIDSYLCVEGYCELRKEVRRFRLSRIKELTLLDQHFDKEEEEKTPEAFLKLAGDQEEDMELLFTGGSIRYVKEYEAARAKQLHEKADGLHFYQRTAIAPDVIRWIRGFGPEVKVLKPVWLEEQLMEEARKRMACYG